ncbi:MAG TPA: sigma-70 family RNA polymerase sigma factor [Terracidiphilus sp.]|nr:sigma-70 family RNA polymerase sigma factor [Terracidiphilus sp.]
MTLAQKVNAAYDAYHTHADEQTLTDLFRAIRRYVEWIASRYTTDPEELGDLITIHVWERLGQYRDHGSFSGWLGTVAKNYSLRHLERTRRERHAYGDDVLALVPCPPAHPIRNLDDLPLTEAQRQVIEAVMRTGSFQDAMAETGLSRSALRTRIYEARKKVQKISLTA